MRAPAKINLRLVVLARESSGFHQIETLFAATDLADEIRLSPGESGIRLHVEGADLGDTADNLVTRAARAWFEEAGVAPSIGITLWKRIPAGAGLGGGSSDAAATLAALDAAAATPLGRARLLRIAARLGSDVPFFLGGAPFAIAWGRGERCLRLPPPADRPLLLGIADAPVSTALAYARLDVAAALPPPAALPDAAELSTWTGIAAAATNDFEAALLPDMPGATRLLDVFRAHGADIAQLTGSGAAVFGVFPNDARRDDAWRAARRASPHAWLQPASTAFNSGG